MLLLALSWKRSDLFQRFEIFWEVLDENDLVLLYNYHTRSHTHTTNDYSFTSLRLQVG